MLFRSSVAVPGVAGGRDEDGLLEAVLEREVVGLADGGLGSDRGKLLRVETFDEACDELGLSAKGLASSGRRREKRTWFPRV